MTNIETVNQAWINYRDSVLLPGAIPVETLPFLKKTFYAGALCYASIQVGMPAQYNNNILRVMEALTKLRRELIAFGENEMKKS